MEDILRVYPRRLRAEEEIAKKFRSGEERTFFSADEISIGNLEGRLLKEVVALKPAGDVLKRLILHSAVLSEPSLINNRHLSALAQSEGFITSVGELIQQFKLGLLKPENLETISGFAKNKEEWIKKVFARYQRGLQKHRLHDDADLRINLVERLSSMKAPPEMLSRYKEIHFHDIYFFTPFRFQLIYLLGRNIKTVVHFPLPDSRAKAFAFVERNIEKFQSLGDKEGKIELSFDDADGVESSSREPGLREFTENIFADEIADGLGLPDEFVEINRNSSRYREIEEVASRIKELQKGAWSDFCLVFRNLEVYGGIIEDVFRRAGIPVFLRRGIPVSHNPYLRLLFGIFRAVETGFDRDELIKLACSDYFSLLPPGLDAGKLENLLMDAGIINGPSPLWKKRIEALSPEKKSLYREEMKAVKKVLALVKKLEAFSKAGRAKKCVESFVGIIRFLGPVRVLAKEPFAMRDLFCRSTLDSFMREFVSGLKITDMESAPFGWKDLKMFLSSLLGNMHLPEWSDKNHVYALDVNELSGKKFPYLFICGLHDGEFPRKAVKGSILNEHEKKRFNEIHSENLLALEPHLKRGRQVFGRLGESWEEESFLFYLAARSALRKLFLFFSSNELDGREINKSPFLDDVYSVYPSIKTGSGAPVAMEKEYAEQIDRAARESKLLRDLFEKGESEAGTLKKYFHHFANLPGSGKSFRLSCEKIKIEKERELFYSEFDEETRASLSTRFTGKVGRESRVSRFFLEAGSKGYSPTALERYSNCRFRYFMDKPLECRPVSLPQAEIERTVKGSVIHEVIAEYFGNPGFAAKPVLTPLSVAKKKILGIAEEVFKRWEAKGIAGEYELWKIATAQIKRSLSLFAEHEDNIHSKESSITAYSEFEFGPDKGCRVEIEVDKKLINFAGSIDRVDYSPDIGSIRVVDYKYTGNSGAYTRLLKPETFGVESFQMPVYMLAARSAALREIPKDKISGVGGAYYFLKKNPAMKPSPGSSNAGLPSLDFLIDLNEGESFGERVSALVESMESGDFSVTPRDCAFCAYRRVCRYKEVRSVSLGE